MYLALLVLIVEFHMTFQVVISAVRVVSSKQFWLDSPHDNSHVILVFFQRQILYSTTICTYITTWSLGIVLISSKSMDKTVCVPLVHLSVLFSSYPWDNLPSSLHMPFIQLCCRRGSEISFLCLVSVFLVIGGTTALSNYLFHLCGVEIIPYVLLVILHVQVPHVCI